MLYRLTEKDRRAIDTRVKQLADFHGAVFVSAMPETFRRVAAETASLDIVQKLRKRNGRRASTHLVNIKEAVKSYLDERWIPEEIKKNFKGR